MGTAALMALVYTILSIDPAGSRTIRTPISIFSCMALSAGFLLFEGRSKAPFLPKDMWHSPPLPACAAIIALSSAASYASVFASFFMRDVMGCRPITVGLAFLPSSIGTAAVSLVLTEKLTTRFGIKNSLLLSLATSFVGLLLLADVRARGNLVTDVVPAIALLGIGCGSAYNQTLLAATNKAAAIGPGFASALIGSSAVVGGTLGLAVFGTVSAMYRNSVATTDAPIIAAVMAEYRVVFLVAAAAVILAMVVAATSLRSSSPATND